MANAALLFSHLILQKSRLSGGEVYENSGFAKIYRIFCDNNISILDADQALDAYCVRSVLSRAGVSDRHIDLLGNARLTNFYSAADLLCYGSRLVGNRNEYLTKNLGFK